MNAYRHEFTVRGALQFPLDMLRYDACWPQSEDAAYTISQSHFPGVVKPFEVVLVHYSAVGRWTPTVARWRSFGWDVCDTKTEKREMIA